MLLAKLIIDAVLFDQTLKVNLFDVISHTTIHRGRPILLAES